ncbi:DNA polymerase III PolC-type [Mesoplasma sp. JKS002658]|uniref:PolC-type DNA polymerase III n=1 Tax=Mesoplasma whartonense TaxID=2878854 RepID=UPI002022B422|nr:MULTISPECIES: PolC-type DNA polymerase III [unclassified Mesoplasma]MCL8211245.1 DNA polymerase III PolC-type [Mesoplasma sp. JKS002664]MCL8211906.1 DNA polymerase III PolC-type [Mesoplasma sp. JKS002662]MCL8213989.1 DNA polymerase III PolC-type [Mesoplasma sp. JKS002658]MCL8214583.1 DNA polymerase III PolC-type [Mesoplasma sp. JKS002663]MCL8215308.1 DNA polymerase III PolC-type [Mesoplasma sp. JKS002659]
MIKNDKINKMFAGIGLSLTAEEELIIDQCTQERVEIDRRKNKARVYFQAPKLLPVSLVKKVETAFKNNSVMKMKLIISVDHLVLDEMIFAEYFDFIKTSKAQLVEGGVKMVLTSNCHFDALMNEFQIKCASKMEFEEVAKDATYYEAKFHQYGLKDMKVKVSLDETLDPHQILEKHNSQYSKLVEMEKSRQNEFVRQTGSKPKVMVGGYKGGKNNASLEIPTYEKLLDVDDNAQNIVIHAYLLDKEIRTSKSGRKIYSLKVSDGTDSIKVTYFAKGETTTIFDDLTDDELKDRDLASLEQVKAKPGDWIAFKGRTNYSEFDREQIFVADSFKKIDRAIHQRLDDAPNKRVELHAHTKMSVMDGISTGSDYLNQAVNWDWKAIAITDHLNVQAFPDAYATLRKINKGRNAQDQFKLIYGSELNLVNENIWYVFNPKGVDLNKAKWVVFDLETTGLSPEFDEIIEFGAVSYDYVSGRREKIDILIKPTHPLKQFTKDLTHITDEMLADKPGIETAFKTIYETINGAILVAHNANFDFDFLQSYAKKLGYPPLENTVIDTLTIARAYWPNLKNHRLGTVAKKTGILYDDKIAHRGDYDADVLTDVFERMWAEIKKQYPIVKDEDWNLIRPVDHHNDANFTRARGVHVNVLAKNQEGLKELYKLISLSHTQEYFTSPKVLKSTLDKFHAQNNLLFGSGCVNGAVFESARTDTEAKLREQINYYDYIEIQPLSVYKHLIQNGALDEAELKAVIKLIIQTAKEENKPVVATSDCHYVDPELKVIRDIYINTKGLGGQSHPLYDYRGKVKDYPDQYLRTTAEMLEEFAWLDDKSLIEEIVITNSQKISAMIDVGIQPVKDGSFAPNIENADQLLHDKCYQTAHEMYGENLPTIVSERLEKELASITKHGFAVIYWISHKLVERSLHDGYLVGSRGSVGSSFVATTAHITEVNPLKAHYRCLNCQYADFETPADIKCGYDLPEKNCPKCGEILMGDGHDIPFETFLGFDGDKVPDIDLNFSGEYQPQAHNFTKEMFGEHNVFRAGTISTVAEKTAFGYVSGYFEKTHDEYHQPRRVEKERLAFLAQGVKRTTGQHPGGIIILPQEYEIEDFTPVNYPADDQNASWLTTHFDFHSIHDNLLKMDILGHVDPTALRMLGDLTRVDPISISTSDPTVYSLFYGLDALNLKPEQINGEMTGAIGIPEFGTEFVRGMLKETKPSSFADLVQISGLSHGTDVWLGNARDLIRKNQANISTVIGCRDDIMVYLLEKHLPSHDAFVIMESVRKGKGLKPEWMELMRKHDVPEWYIESCLKIKYMFPKAHATAYVLMAYRVAWYKIYYPAEYYATYFTTRADAFDLKVALGGYDSVLQSLREIIYKQEHNLPISKKEQDLKTVYEVLVEMYARGIKMQNIDFNLSQGTRFGVKIDEQTREKVIIPPFNVIDSLGGAVANSIELARRLKKFSSVNDLKARTQITNTQMKIFEELKITDSLTNDEQISFDF